MLTDSDTTKVHYMQVNGTKLVIQFTKADEQREYEIGAYDSISLDTVTKKVFGFIGGRKHTAMTTEQHDRLFSIEVNSESLGNTSNEHDEPTAAICGPGGQPGGPHAYAPVAHQHPDLVTKHRLKQFVEDVVFNIKWILPFFYFALVIVLFQLFYAFSLEIWHSIFSHEPYNVEHMKVLALDFVDTVMIANLIKMIITGSYNSFICKDHGYKNERISSGMLKIKIMTSIVVVAAIGLLREFVTGTATMESVYGHLAIFGAFLFGAFALSVIEWLHIKGEQIEHDIHSKH